MSEALFISATGMHAQQTQVDTIANNLANMGTVGFKKARASFEPLMPQSLQAPAQSQPPAGGVAPSYKGMGVGVPAVRPDFSAGELKQTQRELDVAINGRGFFEVEMPDGTRAYSRHGALQVDQNGALVTAAGLPLTGSIQLPPDAASIVIGADGHVRARHPGSDELSEVGIIELAQFVNEAALKPVGDNLYHATETSGDALFGSPGTNGAGTLAQGYLEASNVDMVEELTSLLIAQRAYEANAKVLQAADELLGIVNDLRR